MAHRRRIGIIGIPPHRWKKHRRSRRKTIDSEVDITKFKVVVIESLHEKELHTGHNLYEGELVPISKADDSFVPSYFSVTTVSEFEGIIKDVCENIRTNELVTLHIEAHGDEEKGLYLSSQEYLDWRRLVDMCRLLNEKLNGLLILTTAVCNSMHLLAYIDPFKRAPFLAVIVANDIVKVDQLERGYIAFYQNYKNILGFFNATGALVTELGNRDCHPFRIMTAEEYFDDFIHPERYYGVVSHAVNGLFCMKRAVDPNYTKEQAEVEYRDLINEIAKNRDFFLFRDRR